MRVADLTGQPLEEVGRDQAKTEMLEPPRHTHPRGLLSGQRRRGRPERLVSQENGDPGGQPRQCNNLADGAQPLPLRWRLPPPNRGHGRVNRHQQYSRKFHQQGAAGRQADENRTRRCWLFEEFAETPDPQQNGERRAHVGEDQMAVGQGNRVEHPKGCPENRRFSSGQLPYPEKNRGTRQ
jgi:hypothetical protein